MAVYFIRAVGTPFVKIGFTRNLVKRLKLAQWHCPYELKLIHVAEGDRIAERDFHWRFHKRRVRGEWFRYSDSELAKRIPGFGASVPRLDLDLRRTRYERLRQSLSAIPQQVTP
jgi:hypothetical protein